jgi:hypothetical protein
MIIPKGKACLFWSSVIDKGQKVLQSIFPLIADNFIPTDPKQAFTLIKGVEDCGIRRSDVIPRITGNAFLEKPVACIYNLQL